MQQHDIPAQTRGRSKQTYFTDQHELLQEVTSHRGDGRPRCWGLPQVPAKDKAGQLLFLQIKQTNFESDQQNEYKVSQIHEVHNLFLNFTCLLSHYIREGQSKDERFQVYASRRRPEQRELGIYGGGEVAVNPEGP